MTNAIITMPVNDMLTYARAFAKSGFFGLENEAQAFAIMAIAQAEGLHPAKAAQDYHVIKGRPALKADAMLARFLSGGGKVEWHELSDTKVAATFNHPQGGSVKIDWDKERAKNAGLLQNQQWSKYPRQMLRARVVSEGVRTVFPGANAGFYTVEEVTDMTAPMAAPVDITPPQAAVTAQPEIIEGQKKVEAIMVSDPVNIGKEIAALFKSATNLDDLTAYYVENEETITTLPEKQSKRLMEVYRQRELELNGKLVGV